MLTRRALLAAAAATTAVRPFDAWAAPVEGNVMEIETRAIPSTGEKIPVIGMGTSGSFEVQPGSSEETALRDVVKTFFAGGGTVIDTAPTYSNAEDILGPILAEQNLGSRCWLATKLSGVRGRDHGLDQFNGSLKSLRTDKVELLQVHNLGDVATQAELARELKAEGKARYVGLTHYLESAHDRLLDAMRETRPDFIQINYSVGVRGAEDRLLPAARDMGVAVMINRAFEDGKLFARVKGRELPGWAAEAGVTSWAQAFLKFALSQPAVTVVIPATGKPERQADNLKAGRGPALDQAQRKSLIEMLG
ncbi:aldo/keto reductase [Hansschlegelia plantiphila]|uniref:Aldo/keto reductase n=1 Tax=Hansschlegelia plantiphila TaxID=374655 RepID=A0A9W6MX91_9HYPH|nr:aldo/keto reductase [Hansschlegelia plantiphila]GLK69642.1 aldo/keto reductase [Hansschlegelia plantiphila]